MKVLFKYPLEENFKRFSMPFNDKNESLKSFLTSSSGIEGLTPPDLNYLLDLSDHFAMHLDKKNRKT